MDDNDNAEITEMTHDQRTAEHNAAIDRLVAEGYLDANGERRTVRSRAHAEFLLRAGEIVLEADMAT